MSEDIQLILGFYVIQWLTLALVLIVAKKKRKILILNLGIQAVYSSFFMYNFANVGPGGGVLAVFVFWLLFIAIQWLTTMIHLAILLILRSRKNSVIQKAYDTVFFIFTVESALISLGILSGAITYGKEIGGGLMQIAILIALGISILLKILIPKLDTKTKQAIGVFLILTMLFLCFYYFMEDHFRLI